MVRQRWLSTALFRNAARPRVIRSVLKQAYPSGSNIDDELIDLLYHPTQRNGAAEAFRGFINLFDDYLAPQLMEELKLPVDLIWGERDPWEPLPEAQRWSENIACVRSLTVIPRAGHCPHDETPSATNQALFQALMTPTPQAIVKRERYGIIAQQIRCPLQIIRNLHGPSGLKIILNRVAQNTNIPIRF